ncbi:MAG: CCA tRNA nucleotidyltransferase [Thermoplasmataceae archaeon]
MVISISPELQQLINHIGQYGKSWVVGGTVRDAFAGEIPHDIDLVVNLPISELADILERIGYKVIRTGIAFGVIGVILPEGKIDIAELRGEEYITNSRKPITKRVMTLKEDLERRDFTINAMAINLSTNEVVDEYGGKADLERGVIRAVGNPGIKFSEDPLRLLRAIRFASKFTNGTIEPVTMASIKENAGRLKIISSERIAEELKKGFSLPNAGKYTSLLFESRLIYVVMPDFIGAEEIHHDSRGHHYNESLADHTIRVVNRVHGGWRLKLTAFMHDIGKISTVQQNGDKIQFLRHDMVGSQIAFNILQRLKFSREDVKYISDLIKYHLILHQVSREFQSNTGNPKKTLAKLFLDTHGNMTFLSDLVALAEADSSENYSTIMGILVEMSKTPLIITSKDLVAYVPEHLRSKAYRIVRIKELSEQVSYAHLVAVLKGIR